LLAIAVGIFTGTAEGSILWLQRTRGTITFASHHVVWMSAASYAALYAVIGACAALVALAAPRLISRRLALSTFVAGTAFFLLLPLGWLSRYAIVLLAIGVGVRFWSFEGPNGSRLPRLAWRASLVVLAGLSMIEVSRVALRGRQARGTAPDDAVNVVLIIWDTVRANSLSLYGYDRETTPQLERIARTGTVFENAISTSPWTLPSHASMFTGRLPHEMSADWFVALDRRQPTLAERFREAGWRTGGFVANHHYTSDDSGLDRGFDRYQDFFVSLTQTLVTSSFFQTPSGLGALLGARSRSPRAVLKAMLALDLYPTRRRTSDRKHANVVNREFLAWVDGLDRRPFFAFLNYFDAHRAYWSPDDVYARFADTSRTTNRYDAAIAYLDAQVGALVDSLDARGLLDRTLVVIASDHGELFGEHDQTGHASNLYRNVLHVPLLLRLPGTVPAGFRVEPIVSMVDLAATISTLARLPGDPFPGRTLSSHFSVADQSTGTGWALSEVRPGKSHPENVPLKRGAMTSVTSEGYHWILNGDGVEELYEYDGTGAAHVDLAIDADSTVLAVMDRMRGEARALLDATPAFSDAWVARDALVRKSVPPSGVQVRAGSR